MSDLSLNLFSEAIGVTAELVIVYFIVNYLLNKKEKQKWSPARNIIVRYVAKTYGSIFHAAHQIMSFDYEARHYQEPDKLKGKSVYLEFALKDFQKMQRTIEINNAALDSTLMPIVAEFNDIAEATINKLKYYLQLHNEEHSTKDFVSIPPFDDLERMEFLIDNLKNKYQEIIADSKVIPEYTKSFQELKIIWQEAEKTLQRLYFNPGEYKCNKDRIPLVYDFENLKKISSANITHGAQVTVFHR